MSITHTNNMNMKREKCSFLNKHEEMELERVFMNSISELTHSIENFTNFDLHIPSQCEILKLDHDIDVILNSRKKTECTINMNKFDEATKFIQKYSAKNPSY